MAVVVARATRLPIYSSFAKEGNFSDLFAKGEAFSTLFDVIGIGVGIQLTSTICVSMQGKELVAIIFCPKIPSNRPRNIELIHLYPTFSSVKVSLEAIKQYFEQPEQENSLLH
ncbi:hypothetical protein JHK87_016498 [Glycine soja]|nr:hypothetical protein JHK87_016498 [Glycine soja]